MKTAAIYCRVSTDDQEKEGTSLQTQLDACLKYCQNKGYDLAYRFSETCSGLTLDRPKLNELRELVRNDRFDVLNIYDLDRLSRIATHGVIIRDELDKHNILLESVTEDIDRTPLGEAITYLRGTFSQIEAEKIRERTMRGKAEFVKMGKLPIGTGKGLYGYSWDKQIKKRIPLEYEARVVEKAFLMRAKNIKSFNIARTLNDLKIRTKTGGEWHPRTIHQMLTNPAYIGLTYYGRRRGSRKTKIVVQPESEWILLPDITPPIISRELFDRVQEIIKQDSEFHRARTKQDYLLRGHAVCGYCGSPLVGSFLNHSIRYYHCRGTYATATRQKICNARYIRADYLENVTWDSIKKPLSQPDIVFSSISAQLESERTISGASLDKEIQKLKRNLKNYDSQERRLIQMLRYKEITKDIVLDEMNKLKKDREVDEQQLENYILTKDRIANLENAELQLKDYCQRLNKNLDNAAYQEKREVLEMLAIKVTAAPETVTVNGIIPLESTSTQISDESSDLTHHWMNIGMITWV